MKTIIAALVVAGALLVPSATADVDLGEPDVGVSACHFAQAIGEAGDLGVSACRLDGETVYQHNGRAALVPVKVRANGEWIPLNVYMVQSLWYGAAVALR